MHRNGPILVIDDDTEDLELISDALQSLNVKNEVALFQTGHESFDFLMRSTEKPFMIICDVNMSQMSGFELRRKIIDEQELNLQSVPFLFLSTSGNGPDISMAYKLAAQGYFKKPDSFEKIKQMLRSIIDYWQICIPPILDQPV